MPHRVAALTLAVLVALAFGGCGGKDTSNSGGTSGGAAEPAAATPKPADDETKIRALSAEFARAWNAKDWGGVCDRLSPSAQAQIREGLAAGGRDVDTCEQAMEAASAPTGADQIRISITSVRITADEAVAPDATVETDGTTQDTHFERVDGEWFVSSGSEG